ncbi:hypothetical protein [Streptomyces sp. NPDC058045]|uniref:hypothetical protein n=1 Tax=Streptomyces sp. NPDC058045 TaxID=3346311 RepID=UPI0036EC8156
MENNGAPLTSPSPSPPPSLTPEAARAALAEVEEVRVAAVAVAATPWPTWFFLALAGYLAALPVVLAGATADAEWGLPRAVWSGVLVGMIVVYFVLFGVAARRWRSRTGVALRLDVLPKRATVPMAIGLPVLLVGSVAAFHATGDPGWLVADSVIAAATSVGYHLAFHRLHRKTV